MAEIKEAPRPKAEGAKAQEKATEVARRPGAGLAHLAEHPFSLMKRFSDEMDRVFEDFGLRVPGFVGRGRELLRRETGMIPAEWSPRVEVRERDGKLLVRADLPGLSKDDIKVEVANDVLTIQGERKQEKKEEREGYAYSECSYGSFYRSIPLPEGTDAANATAEFHNGVLEIAMPTPRKPQEQARRIEVHQK